MAEGAEAQSAKPEQATGASEKIDKLTADLRAIVAEQQQEGTEEVSHPETEEFLNWLTTTGIVAPDIQAARETLDDPNLFNQPLKPILEKLGMTMEDARGIGMQLKHEITKVTGARFKEYIAGTDWRSRLTPENIQVDDGSSSESMTGQQVSEELVKILDSGDMQFAQGAVWNMTTSKDSRWVAKFLKSGEGASSPEYAMNKEMEEYKEIIEVFGQDFLLDQVAVNLEDTGTPILLQEKLDLDQWHGMGSFNENVIKQVQDTLSTHPENQAILADFLDHIALLESSKGLVLDFSGDNVVFQQDQQGRLDIKILDYGCTKLEGEDPQRLAQLHGHAGALRALAA